MLVFCAFGALMFELLGPSVGLSVTLRKEMCGVEINNAVTGVEKPYLFPSTNQEPLRPRSKSMETKYSLDFVCFNPL